MDEPLWPVVRESARRFLRLQHLRIQIPKEYMSEFHKTVLHMADMQPSRTEFPTASLSEKGSIILSLHESEEELEGTVVYIGQDEPDQGVCWIKSDPQEGWNLLLEASRELLKAGYPGCLGCGGPNAEIPWNEKDSRTRIKKDLEKVE